MTMESSETPSICSETILNALRASLGRIRNPRLFATERGYQGSLIAELTEELRGQGIFINIGSGDPMERALNFAPSARLVFFAVNLTSDGNVELIERCVNI